MSEINNHRMANMTELLQTQLQPSHLIIEDESHLHAGHVGAQSGKGHFFVELSSSKFTGVSPVKVHQMIYASLGNMMDEDIHALRIAVKR